MRFAMECVACKREEKSSFSVSVTYPTKPLHIPKAATVPADLNTEYVGIGCFAVEKRSEINNLSHCCFKISNRNRLAVLYFLSLFFRNGRPNVLTAALAC